ncbi:unnamed protein product [Larinioides sclopetarius]|uniref:Uncharacterized protein n=1 Tax=Larinioides sclopetarius TaxID=280406 RepID=A0AAV1Z6W3_9ARAC
METARISDERAQLLKDIANRINQLLLQANFLDMIPILDRDDSCDEQAPLDGNGTISNEQTPLDANHNVFNKPVPLDANHNEFNEQMPLDGYHNVFHERTPLDGNGAIFNEGSSDSDTNSQIIPCPRTSERRTNEVSLEEVVQAMYLAWLRNRQPKREVTLNFFTTKELYALHLGWKNGTRGRSCSSQPHKVAEALATTIAKELLPIPKCDENDLSIHFHIEFTTTKNLLVANLLDEWTLIRDGDWFPARYIETMFEDSDEQPPAVSEFWLGQVELYDKTRDFFLNPKLQIVLHIILFIWPLSILVIEAVHFIDIDPATEPDSNHCVKNFYSAALVTNYVSIALVSAYVLVYFITMCANRLSFWGLAIRYL